MATIRVPQQNKNYFIEVAKGNVPGASLVRVLGRNTDVDTAEEDVWFQGGNLTYLSSAEKMNIVSTSANDTSAGTGARTVTIQGLNSSYAAISETVSMNGTTNVLTTNSYLRVNEMFVATAGSGGKTAGTVTATAQSAATIHASMPVGENVSGKTHYTVPAGKTAYLLDFLPSLAAGKTGCDVALRARASGSVFRMYSRLAVQSTGTSAINHAIATGAASFAAQTDIKVTAKGAANDQDVFVEYILLLVDN